MNKPNTYVFVEGETEKRILKKMIHDSSHLPFVFGGGNGKTNLPNEIEKMLDGEIRKNSIFLLILRDRDDEEEYPDIIQSFERPINKLLNKEKISSNSFVPHKDFANLFLMDVPDINFRSVLHIAPPQFISSLKFASDTIDGYTFALAMCDQVLQRFASDAKITSDVLRDKVLIEVPKLATDNGIEFNQAKDMLGVYMAMSRFFEKKGSEDKDKFTDIVMSRAIKYANEDFQNIMRSLFAALKILEVSS